MGGEHDFPRLLATRHGVFELLDFIKYGNRERHRTLAGLRESHASASSFIQFNAEISLKCLHALRNSDLVDSQLYTRFREAAVLRHRKKTAQSLEIHHIIGFSLLHGWPP
jgi:hypothetical protein